MSGVHARGVKVIHAENISGPAPATRPDARIIAPVGNDMPPVKVDPVVGKAQPAPQTAPLPQPVIKSCARPFAADITLVDGAPTAAFDKLLRRRLSAGKGAVVIDLIRPYAASGEPPAALIPWLNEVKASGGILSIKQYCSGSRGIFADFFHKLFGGSRKEQYRAARRYDATLQVDALDQVVTQVQFTPRAGSQ